MMLLEDTTTSRNAADNYDTEDSNLSADEQRGPDGETPATSCKDGDEENQEQGLMRTRKK